MTSYNLLFLWPRQDLKANLWFVLAMQSNRFTQLPSTSPAYSHLPFRQIPADMNKDIIYLLFLNIVNHVTHWPSSYVVHLCLAVGHSNRGMFSSHRLQDFEALGPQRRKKWNVGMAEMQLYGLKTWACLQIAGVKNIRIVNTAGLGVCNVQSKGSGVDNAQTAVVSFM